MQKLLIFSQYVMSSLRAQQHTVNPAMIVPNPGTIKFSTQHRMAIGRGMAGTAILPCFPRARTSPRPIPGVCQKSAYSLYTGSLTASLLHDCKKKIPCGHRRYTTSFKIDGVYDISMSLYWYCVNTVTTFNRTLN